VDKLHEKKNVLRDELTKLKEEISILEGEIEEARD